MTPTGVKMRRIAACFQNVQLFPRSILLRPYAKVGLHLQSQMLLRANAPIFQSNSPVYFPALDVSCLSIVYLVQGRSERRQSRTWCNHGYSPVTALVLRGSTKRWTRLHTAADMTVFCVSGGSLQALYWRSPQLLSAVLFAMYP